MGGASQQLMLIHVGGVLQDPQVSREAFPAVNQGAANAAAVGGVRRAAEICSMNGC